MVHPPLRTVLLALPLLATLGACKDKDVVDDTDTGEPIDTDTGPTDTGDDTGTVETGDTSESDTAVTIPVATIPQLRDNSGNWGTGQVVEVQDVIVTAVWTNTSGTFLSVQDKTATEKAALVVDFPTGSTPPARGDQVTVLGAYAERSVGSDDATVLTVSTADPTTSVTVTGTGAVTPKVLQPDELSNNVEFWEFMVIKLEDRDSQQALVPLEVRANPNSSGEFPVAGEQTFLQVSIVPVLHDLAVTHPGLAVGDTFDAITGVFVVLLNNGQRKLAPRDAADATNYTTPPDDTGDSGHTDETDEPGETDDTGTENGLLDIAADQLVISEVMLNPTSCTLPTDGQYVELHYTGPIEIDLAGLQLINDNGDIFTASSYVVGPTNRWALMHFGPGGNGCFGFDEMGWGGAFSLNTAGDTLTLTYAGAPGPFDTVTIDGSYPRFNSKAIEHAEAGAAFADNDDPDEWCIAVDTFHGGLEYGTPGAEPTCTPGDTDVQGPTLATPAGIHQGLYANGAQILVENLIVTAVYDGPSPQDAFFTAQVNTQTPSTSEGLWVFKGASTGLPAVGDVVDIEGAYAPDGTIPGRDAHDVVNVSNGVVDILSSGNPLPPPVSVGLGDVLRQAPSPVTAPPAGEVYEGMLVTATPASTWTVCSVFSSAGTDFIRYRVTGQTCSLAFERYVGGSFFNVASLNATGTAGADVISSITGIVRYQDRSNAQTYYDIHPRSASDISYLDQ